MRISSVDAVTVKNSLNLGFSDVAVFILVNSFKSFADIEGLVAEQSLSKGLNLALLIKNVLNETKEHHVLDASLLLIFFSFCFISLILLFLLLAFFSVFLLKLKSFLLSAFTFLLNLLFPPKFFFFSLFLKLFIFLLAFSNGQFAFLFLNSNFVFKATALLFHELFNSFSLLLS